MLYEGRNTKTGMSFHSASGKTQSILMWHVPNCVPVQNGSMMQILEAQSIEMVVEQTQNLYVTSIF